MEKPLHDYQIEAISNMKNGCILCGGVGTGKSLTSIGYYHMCCGGDISFLVNSDTSLISYKYLPNLYIITTARKRDTNEWEPELAPFHMSSDPNKSAYSKFGHKVIIDSWNNITKYVDVKESFFIFDEQRVVGKGKWVKSFLKIAKVNQWILLSATPGDSWEDYIPVFIANGFYRNRTDFCDQHVTWNRYTTWPQIDQNRWKLEGILIKHRNDILVDMKFDRKTVRHHENVYCNFDIPRYKFLIKHRCDISSISPELLTKINSLSASAQIEALIEYNCEPIENASMLCYQMRKIVNSSDDRQVKLLEILEDHPKAIIFYNFDYELEILKSLGYSHNTEIREWNGHNHEPLPTSDKWVYLIQYTAGAEGWNCTTTDTIIFFSQSYSYKTTEQACGRIDRLNTPYTDLYYYYLKSHAGIDMAIARALNNKKNFNESRFIKKGII